MGGPGGLSLLLALAGTVAAATPTHPGRAQPPQPVSEPAAGKPDPTADWGTLLDADAARMAQGEAAKRLLLSDDAATRARLASLLNPPASDDHRSRQAHLIPLLLEQIQSMTSAPAWLGEPLASFLQKERISPLALQAARALASVRTQISARALVDAANLPDGTIELRRASISALQRMTGRTELSRDPHAWAGWLKDLEFLPEADWRRVLFEGLAARTDELTQREELAVTRLVEARRHEFLDLPQGGRARWDLLAGLLVDEFPGLRLLGIELVNRELANGRLPDAIVIDSAAELLSDSNEEFRAAGAELMAALAPPNAEALMSDALLRERDPVAAGAMLQAMVRWPTPQIRPAAMDWLRRGGISRSGAIEALAALRRAGQLTDSREIETVAQTLEGMPPESMSDAATWLLVQVGTPKQREGVAAWLKSPSATLRVRAAEALAGVPDGFEPLVAAAKTDANLFPPASRACLQHRATPAGFLELATLPFPTPEQREIGLALVGEKLALADLVSVARSLQPASAREAVLAKRFVPGKIEGEAAQAGLILLAQTRLALGQPSRVLEAIDLMEGPENHKLPPEALAARCTALVWLNRLDDAARLAAPASAWLDGLEYAATLPHAATIADRITEQFGAKLNPAERARLDGLRQKLQAEAQDRLGG